MQKVAVVTGGAQRIGSAIARHLHERGYDIALHYRSSATSAAELAAQLCAIRPDSCELFQADMQHPEQVTG